MIKGSIRFEFMGEDPLARYDMGTSWAINQAPSPIGLKGTVFMFHGSMSVWITEHDLHRGWQWLNLTTRRRIEEWGCSGMDSA
jgi:hypothetical protein